MVLNHLVVITPIIMSFEAFIKTKTDSLFTPVTNITGIDT